MFKLMKYEFRKQLLSKVVILAALAILEAIFLYGLFTESERAVGTSVGIFMVVAFIAIMFVSFECVFTFSKDLRTKQSYMLFLTPNSAYSIVGAKIIATVVQIFLTGMAFAAVVILDFGIVAVKFNSVNELLDMIQRAIKEIFELDIQMNLIVSLIIYLLIYWINVVIIAMLAITLSHTFLANKKFKGLVSVILFFAINWAIGKVLEFIMPNTLDIDYTLFLGASGILLVITALAYVGTAWMLDKKVSV